MYSVLIVYYFYRLKDNKMAPNTVDANGVLFESDAATPDMALPITPVQRADNSPRKYVWRNIIAFTYLHIAALYGGYLFLFSAKWQTDIFGEFYFVLTASLLHGSLI